MKHGIAGDARVDGQGQVVQDDKEIKERGLADGPWLVLATTVDLIRDEDGDDVAGGEGQRDLAREQLVVESRIDCEGASE